VRGVLGALASGVAPLIASKWLQRQGKSRPKAYFYPTPLADRHDHGDQASDQRRNPDTASVSLVDRMPDREKPQKKSSGNSVTVAAETNIDCDSSAPKSENFLCDRGFDQANQKPSNPVPASISMPDRMPDRANHGDQAKETPPYPSIGDWIYARPNKKYPGEVCYAKEFVKSEIRAAVFRQGKVGTVNVSRWTWEQGEWEPYDPKKHPPIPQALLDHVRLVIEKPTTTIEIKPQEPTEIVESSGPPEPKFKEGDRIFRRSDSQYGTISKWLPDKEEYKVHLDKSGEWDLKPEHLDIFSPHPDWEIGDRCRFGEKLGTISFVSQNDVRVIWDKESERNSLWVDPSVLSKETAEGGELLPAPREVANYLRLNVGDKVRILKHPQHHKKWWQKGGLVATLVEVKLSYPGFNIFAIAQIPGEEFLRKIFLDAVDIVEETSGDRGEG